MIPRALTILCASMGEAITFLTARSMEMISPGQSQFVQVQLLDVVLFDSSPLYVEFTGDVQVSGLKRAWKKRRYSGSCTIFNPRIVSRRL